MKKIFGELNLTWTKIILFAIIAGVYTAIMTLLPITKYTSFRDIAISFECWILFGIIIIMNSKSAKDSALKCFVFFLISQPLIYLIQDIINHTSLFFTYYRYWFIWTIACLPMGYIGYYMKKDKWWGLLILIPILILLGFHYYGFLSESFSFFPSHILSCLFCVLSLIIYPLYIFKDKKIKNIGLVISTLIILIATILVICNGKITYNTTLLTSNGEDKVYFDDKYKVYFSDDSYGKAYIVYEKNIEDYMINVEFSKLGKTQLIIESPDGEKITYDVIVKRDTYEINRNR